MKLYHTNEIAKILKLDEGAIRYRAKALQIERQTLNNERHYFYTEQQMELIRDFKRKSRPASKKNLYQKNKIEIIEFFKANKSNTMEVIREKFNTSMSVVEKALSEYLKDRCVIVASKMNTESKINKKSAVYGTHRRR